MEKANATITQFLELYYEESAVFTDAIHPQVKAAIAGWVQTKGFTGNEPCSALIALVRDEQLPQGKVTQEVLRDMRVYWDMWTA